jgi:hypothetical protein
MANLATVRVLESGPRNIVVHAAVFVDTANLAETVVIDATNFPTDDAGALLTTCAIEEIEWSVPPPLCVRLEWKATTNTDAYALNASDHQCFPSPITNNAGAGKTGNLVMSTLGWTAGPLLATFVLRARKMAA